MLARPTAWALRGRDIVGRYLFFDDFREREIREVICVG